MINFARSMQAQLIEEMVPKRVEDFTNKELLELKQNIIILNSNILKELRKRNIFVNNNLSSAKNEFVDKANVELQRRKPKRNENTTIPDVLRYNGFCEGVWYICKLLNDLENEQKVFWKSEVEGRK